MSIGILIPVFNDWTSLAQLLAGLDKAASSADTPLSVLVVDDGSTEAPWEDLCDGLSHLG